jgi:hypothetical protein
MAGKTSSVVAQIGVAATNGGTVAVFMNRALIEEDLIDLSTNIDSHPPRWRSRVSLSERLRQRSR